MSAGELIPTTGLKQCIWKLEQRQTKQYSRNGSSQVIKLGEAFWVLRFEFENMTDANFRALTAFLSRRKGAIVSFSAYRPDRIKALLHSDGNAPSALTVSGDEVTVTMNNSEAFSPGDMISYAAGAGGRYVGEVLSITSHVTNTTVAVVEPAPVAAHATHDAQTEAAWGLFTLEPDSIMLSEPFDITKRATFTARQVEPQSA